MKILEAIGSALYERVWLAYKSSLTALALVAADAIVSSLQTEPLPQWLHVAVGIVAMALLAYKKTLPKVVAVPIPLDPPPGSGFARLGLMPALAAVCLIVTGCALFKGASGTATVNGEAANIAITLPSGTDVGVTIANSQACVSGPFVPLPIFNFECDTACGTLVGTIGVTLTCRVVGTEGPTFPWQFALTTKQQVVAAAMVARNPSALRMRAP